jgi:hypothetical protein
MWPWPGVEMYKVGLLALSALALLAEAAYASDKIALPCSGMMWSKGLTAQRCTSLACRLTGDPSKKSKARRSVCLRGWV